MPTVRVSPGGKGPAIEGGVGKFGTDIIDEGLGCFSVRGMSRADVEAAAFDGVLLSLGGGGDGITLCHDLVAIACLFQGGKARLTPSAREE